MATATTEPLELTAGFTSSWDKTLSEYLPSLYTLEYTLAPIAGGEVLVITATSTLDTFNLRLTPTITSGLSAGTYQLIGYVKDIATSGETTTARVSTTRTTVLAAVNSIVDRRTFAEEIVADLQATYAKLAKNTISSATVNGRTYTKKDLMAIREEIAFFQNKVRSEMGGATRRIAVTFPSVT